MKKINIAIVDDHNLFRKGLIKLINLGDSLNQYSILFEASNGTELRNKLDKKLLPDIILMDIDMPDMDGFETVDWLKNYFPHINILVISMLETEEAIIRMLRMGVKGYLSKDIEVEDMHEALDAITNNQHYYSEAVTNVMAAEMKNDSGKILDSSRTGVYTSLTENEKQLLKYICTDLTYSQIADKMFLSPKTIEGYRDNLCKKLNISTRVQLALFAVKTGIYKL